jgi:hypothetical protein
MHQFEQGQLFFVKSASVAPSGKVRYNIVWVNRTTITVWGDVMHKKG